MDFAPNTVDLSKYIDTQFYGERPHIRGRKLLVSFIADAAQSQGWSVSDLVEQYSITEEQASAALLYYYEHKTLIDEQDKQVQHDWEIAYAQQDTDWLQRWENRHMIPQEKMTK